MFHTFDNHSANANVCVTGVTLKRLKLFGASYSAAVFIRSAPIKSYHVLIPLSGNITAKTSSKEFQVKPGTAIFCPTGSRLQMHWSEKCLVLIAIIPQMEFEKSLQQHSYVATSAATNINKIDLSSGPGKSFINLLNCLCVECNNYDESDSIEMIPAGLQELLLLSLVQLYANAYGEEHSLQGTYKRRQAIMRAIEFLHGNTHRAISMKELSETAYLSPRSLQMGFKESFGIGPMAYSKSLRLAQAHTALSKNNTLSITEVALQYGFNNYGTFSRLYKQQYGELPSTTLGKSQKPIKEVSTDKK